MLSLVSTGHDCGLLIHGVTSEKQSCFPLQTSDAEDELPSWFTASSTYCGARDSNTKANEELIMDDQVTSLICWAITGYYIYQFWFADTGTDDK